MILHFRRSESGRVCAPVEFRHIHYLIRLRAVSREVSNAFDHVVRLLDAVVNVPHRVGVAVRVKTVDQMAGLVQQVVEVEVFAGREPMSVSSASE